MSSCKHLCPFPPIFLHFPPFFAIFPRFPPFFSIFPHFLQNSHFSMALRLVG